jgi:hypothetical protein
MAGVLPQYLATSSTYGVKPPTAPTTAFARPTAAPITTGTTATRVGAPTTGVAGGRTAGVSAVGGVAASTYGRPAPTPAPAPAARPQTAAPTGLTTSPYVNPFADDGSQAKRQAEMQAQMDARSQAQREASMAQQQFDLQMAQMRQQGSGGDYGGGGGYQPMPIPIAPGETPEAAPAAAGPTMVMPGAQPQSPDVGTGWADFAARPAGPQGLGMSRQSVPMQQLRATRAGGGLY